MLFVPSLHQTNNLRDALSDWTGNASSSIKTAIVFTVFLLTLRKLRTESTFNDLRSDQTGLRKICLTNSFSFMCPILICSAEKMTLVRYVCLCLFELVKKLKSFIRIVFTIFLLPLRKLRTESTFNDLRSDQTGLRKICLTNSFSFMGVTINVWVCVCACMKSKIAPKLIRTSFL